MSIFESLVLDSLALNDRTNFIMQDFDFGIAPKRWQWISGTDSDGAVLPEEAHYDNAEMTVRIRVAPQATMDAALAKIGQIVDKLQECEQQPLGLAAVWTPAGSTNSKTAYIVGGEVTGIPLALSGDDAGWFLRNPAPVVTVKLYRRPFLYATEVTTVLDDFSTDSIGAGKYTFDLGVGTIAVAGGVLVPSSTAEKRFYRSGEGLTYSDVQVTLKVTTGAAVTGGKGVLVKRLDANGNFIEARADGATLSIIRWDAGVQTTLPGSAAWVLSASTSYWVRLRVEGNRLTAEGWTSAPTPTGTPAVSTTYDLAGADATKFGVGVTGNAGVRVVPAATDYRYDDFTIEPNVFKSSSPYVTPAVYGVTGDVPAEARLVITDAATQVRRHAEWGLQQRYYSAGVPTILDQFGTDTISSGAWAFDTGSGTIAVSGGQLVPSTTADKWLYRTDSTYTDATGTVKFTTGASVAGFVAVFAKRLSPGSTTNSVFVQINGSSGALSVEKFDGGAGTSLASTAGAALAVSTSYWLRTRVVGDVVTGELFTADPATGASATRTVTHTLVGANATKFGQGIAGQSGIRFLPAATDWRADDFRICPLQGCTELLIDSECLLTSGFAGTQTTRTGAYTGGTVANHVDRITVRNVNQVVCGTGNLAHVGTFRVKARIYSTATQNTVRLSYREGDGPLRSNAWATPAVQNNWAWVDLGVITVPEKLLGTQRWTGQIECYDPVPLQTTLDGTNTVDVDYLVFIPADEGYGKARAPYIYSAGVQNGRDEFSGITAATVLNARVAPTGGTWATSGATTDFAAADAPGTAETESRSTTADSGAGRFAVLGATNYTDSETAVDVYMSDTTTAEGGVVARWVDASNYLRVRIKRAVQADLDAGLPTPLLVVTKTIAGTHTTVAFTGFELAASTWYTVKLVVLASGNGTAYVLDSSGNALATLPFTDTVLATGGTLATGKPGFYDANAAIASTRYYDNFSHMTPAAERAVVYSGRTAEIRHDSAIRQDSTGTYYGPIDSYRGARFYLRPAGDESRVNRIIALARRNDVDIAADDQIADSTTATVHYTPRYLVVPR